MRKQTAEQGSNDDGRRDEHRPQPLLPVIQEILPAALEVLAHAPRRFTGRRAVLGHEDHLAETVDGGSRKQVSRFQRTANRETRLQHTISTGLQPYGSRAGWFRRRPRLAAIRQVLATRTRGLRCCPPRPAVRPCRVQGRCGQRPWRRDVRRPLGHDPADVSHRRRSLFRRLGYWPVASNQAVRLEVMRSECSSDLPGLIIIRPRKPQASFAARLAVLCFLAVDNDGLLRHPRPHPPAAGRPHDRGRRVGSPWPRSGR